MWADLPVVYFYYYHIHFFFAAHLVEKSSRVLTTEAGGKEKERDGPNSKLFKDFLLLDFLYCIV